MTNKLLFPTIYILIVIFGVTGVVLYVNGKLDLSPITNVYNSINQAFSDTINSGVSQGGVSNQSPTLDKTKEIDLEQVDNLGYTFYLGQIDNPGAAPISDSMKNDITRVIYNAKFPKSLLIKIPIVFVNNLALKSGQYISFSGKNMPVPDFGAGFLYEGGIYATYQSGSSMIYINDDVLAKDSLADILTHELGHAIGSTLTTADWKTYFSLRNIPPGTHMEGASWNLSPAEDFAEVYKNTFTGLGVRTYYGLLLPAVGEASGGFSFEKTCGPIYTQIYNSDIAAYEKTNPPIDCSKITDIFQQMNCSSDPTAATATQKQQADDSANASVKVQDCRRNVMAYPDQYPNDWIYGMTPYKSTVGPETKAFINTIVSRSN